MEQKAAKEAGAATWLGMKHQAEDLPFLLTPVRLVSDLACA